MYAVFGNPIAQSRSPFIHVAFGRQTGIPVVYEKRLAPLQAFVPALEEFVSQGGKGANVTAPFKEEAFHYCARLTDRAKQAGAVNTLKWFDSGECLGDNTDGIGLLMDLQRLEMIKKGARVLLIGAGGAARGIIAPILSVGAQITITNRTFQKAENLEKQFRTLGMISATAEPSGEFDLIINASSAGLRQQAPEFPAVIISAKTACYDLIYSENNTPFIEKMLEKGARNVADGLGMLVGQAAQAFFLWQGVLPEITSVLSALRASLAQRISD